MRRSFVRINLLMPLVLLLWASPGYTQGDPGLLTKIKTLESKVRTLEAKLEESQNFMATLKADVKNLKAKKGEGALTKEQRRNLNRLKENWPALKAMSELSPYVIIDKSTINGLKGPHVLFVGANVHIRSGSKKTSDGKTLTGLGNLVIGYNKERPSRRKKSGKGRSGSHNLIVGDKHQYTSYGGIVAGDTNTISQIGATVLGGRRNIASGKFSSVTGGSGNQANGQATSISGGQNNQVNGQSSSVSGGFNLKISGDFDWGAGNLFQDQ